MTPHADPRHTTGPHGGAHPVAMPWSAWERETLRCAAARIVPADASNGLPGADDVPITDDMLASAGAARKDVGAALHLLDGLVQGRFAEQDTPVQDAALGRLQAGHPDAFMALACLVMQCYYRDTRVMQALGMEPRPPFPKGFEVEEGDWSLLDPVRNRASRIYRPAD